MGQQVTVIEKPTSRSGVVRYEINRVLTGMGHESYSGAPDAGSVRPPDVLARRLFGRGGIKTVHINGSVITIELAETGTEGIQQIIEGLYTYYLPGVLPPTDEELVGPPAE
ncbi:unannotated protein [freshwater metagenome]|uniref:Unannotated protein n=1 Tax=freshwater metagenome TaxID=449393 RepID=A0A6J7RE44_9ZZZZ|nr:hypothetical protein [Actinomycetota bacterium]MSY72182.1 hypothetical protein [Actinomycetota bacterium]